MLTRYSVLAYLRKFFLRPKIKIEMLLYRDEILQLYLRLSNQFCLKPYGELYLNRLDYLVQHMCITIQQTRHKGGTFFIHVETCTCLLLQYFKQLDIKKDSSFIKLLLRNNKLHIKLIQDVKEG